MTGEIVPVPVGENLPASFDVSGIVQHSEEEFSAVSQTGDYFSRLQLMTAASDAVKDEKIEGNHWAIISGNSFIDLGKQCDVLVFTWRPKALRMGDEVIAVYEKDSPEFKKIEEESYTNNSGCMYGPEFLIWEPTKKMFVALFMGSKSARREAANLLDKLGKSVTLTSKLIKTAKYSWFAPKILACSTPFDLPTIEAVKEAAEKFNNPKSSEVETVDEVPDERAR